MRILHITASPLNPIGGISVVLKNIVKNQNEIEGVEAKVLSLCADIGYEHITYVKNDYRRFIEDYKPDIAIIHGFFYLEFSNVSNELAKNKIPYFIEPHGSFVVEALKKGRIKKYIANRTIFRRLINNAYGYIYLSEEERDNSYYKTEHDLIIPNGISASDDCYEGIHSDSLYFIGRYDICHKGLDILLDSLEILDRKRLDIQIDFYGDGKEKDVKYIERRISMFKYVKCFNKGPIYGTEKNKIILSHGIMLLTSRFEGFPMTVLEAWQMGNPCIVTPQTNITAIVRKEKLGWVTELNSDSIADTIIQALDEYRANRNEYTAKCKEYVNSNYMWSNVAEVSIERLEKALALREADKG